MAQAIHDFSMIEEGDRIMVAVSGGKDSYTLHDLLVELATRSPVRFSLVAVNIDQGHPGYPGHVLTSYMREHGHEFVMVAEDTYSIVTDKIPSNKTYCSLCSRLRRGILYRLAREMNCTKIALGHHRDDVLATLLLNLFFSGQLKAMPPKLISDDGDNVVIRPLAYCAEDDIAAYSAAKGFPILPCDLCGSQDNLQRKQMNDLISEMERKHPNTRANMLAALRNVRPSHLLDAGLWRALDLSVAGPEDAAPAATEDAPQGERPAADELFGIARLVRRPEPG
jgi:tRNA 2-thiocytidine biosynthesis protein TtcA